jgi:ADP-heptose:LPS heptosyltransferase
MIAVIALVERAISKARRVLLLPLHAVGKLSREALRVTFYLMFDHKWLIDRFPTASADTNSVLLIRLDLIGDFVLWLDSARAYRNLYPTKKIVLCVNSICSELADNQPWWDEIIQVDINRLRSDRLYGLRLMISLRWRGFGTVIQPTFSRELAVDRLVRATKAAERIGQKGDANNITPTDKAITDAWYTTLIQAGDLGSMELTKNAEFVRALGAKDFRSSVATLRSTGATSLAFKTQEPYILLSPGASWLPKAWPAQHFAQLATDLFLQYGIPIVLCGSLADRTICESVVKLVHTSGQQVRTPVHNLAGQTTLTQLLDLIAGAALLISNDSGNIHLAAALRVPSVCIVGGGHSARFMPYIVENADGCVLPSVALYRMDCFGCHWRCQYEIEAGAAVPCVANVAVVKVKEHCRKLLATGSYQRQLEARR